MSVISCQKQKAWTSLDSKGEKNLSFLVYSYLVSFNCCCLVAKSYMTLLWPHGLEPARLLCPWDFPGKNTGWEGWVATSFSRESSGPRDPTWVSCIVGRFFTAEPVGKRDSIVNVATYCHHVTDEESEALSGAPCRVRWQIWHQVCQAPKPELCNYIKGALIIFIVVYAQMTRKSLWCFFLKNSVFYHHSKMNVHLIWKFRKHWET